MNKPQKPHACSCNCNSTHPVDVLHEEHRVILRVLEGMAGEVEALRAGGRIRTEFWTDALGFIEHFADRCHHGKEEELLFAELERAGMGHDHGPVACMRHEHDQGRAATAQMTAALQGRDAQGLAHVAASYVDFLRDHIAKEETVLFPLALEMLDDAAIARLRAGYAAHEQMLGADLHERWLRIAEHLGAPAGRS